MNIGAIATGVASPVTEDSICPIMLGFLGTVSVLFIYCFCAQLVLTSQRINNVKISNSYTQWA